jgi:hypothetical protein
MIIQEHGNSLYPSYFKINIQYLKVTWTYISKIIGIVWRRQRNECSQQTYSVMDEGYRDRLGRVKGLSPLDFCYLSRVQVI